MRREKMSPPKVKVKKKTTQWHGPEDKKRTTL